MHAIVGYSGGIGSWAAGMRAVERYGRQNVTLLFADTKYEDPDLYRFLHEGAAVIGVPVTIIADGRDPWQVFRDERYLGNTRIDPCSKLLKRQLCDAWVKTRYAPSACIRLVGMDYCQKEADRLTTLRRRAAPYTVESPLFWEPPLDKDLAKLWALKCGLQLPHLYALGFAHNNCGGCCIKQGQRGWAHLYRVLPERYEDAMRKEKALADYLGKPVAILRDRQGGTTKPLTLEAFKERLDHQPELDFDNTPAEDCHCFA